MKFKQQIEKSQNKMKELNYNSQNHSNLLQINPNDNYTETKLNEIKSQFTTKERTRYKFEKLDDNYCIFIASRWFDSIDDFINLTFVSKRMRGTMEKFHYNPIPLTKSIRPFFPNIETLYIYDILNCELFENDKKFMKRICVQPISTQKYIERESLFRNVQFTISPYVFSKCSSLTTFKFVGIKNLVLDEEFCSSCESLHTIEFENCPNITIGRNAFNFDKKLSTITLKSSNFKTLGYFAFANCNSLTSIDMSDIGTVNSYAFSSLKLSSLTINANTIGSNAFAFSEINEVTMKSVKTLSNKVFEGLKTSTLNFDSVQNVGGYAFNKAEIKTLNIYGSAYFEIFSNNDEY